MLNKHKLFLLCAKWIPVVTAIGILVTNTISTLNKGVKRISKAYACEHILHCSPATFDNYVRAGIIPKGKKEVGFNELSWSLKDFDGVKLQRIHKK